MLKYETGVLAATTAFGKTVVAAHIIAARNTNDPVPYLNREENVINGLINGRERLMPGERLVWLPAPEDAETESAVVFEMRTHCQVVSRTWKPERNNLAHAVIHGTPAFVLEDFDLLKAELCKLANSRALAIDPVG